MLVIDRNELNDGFANLVPWCIETDEEKAYMKGLEDAYKVVVSSNIIDAVPVVRCRECKHRDPEDHKCDCGELERAGCVFPVDDDYFCKWGKR